MNYLQGSFMNKKSLRTLSSLAIAIATLTSGAYAAELEEVIVTAQKRAESLQEVPVSLTAISCLLYTSPSPRDRQKSRMPSSA